MSRQHLLSMVLASIVLASGTVAASGSIYKWVDQNGVTQYTQTPPPKTAKSSQTVRVSTHVPVDVREGQARGMVDADTLRAYMAPPNSPVALPNPPNTPPMATDTASETTEPSISEQPNQTPTATPSPIAIYGDRIQLPSSVNRIQR